jgi:hypothetical protein
MNKEDFGMYNLLYARVPTLEFIEDFSMAIRSNKDESTWFGEIRLTHMTIEEWDEMIESICSDQNII